MVKLRFFNDNIENGNEKTFASKVNERRFMVSDISRSTWIYDT